MFTNGVYIKKKKFLKNYKLDQYFDRNRKSEISWYKKTMNKFVMGLKICVA